MDDGLVFKDGLESMVQIAVRPHPTEPNVWQMGLLAGPEGNTFTILVVGSKDVAENAAIYLCLPLVSDHTRHVLTDGYIVYGTFYVKEIVIVPSSEAPDEIRREMAKFMKTRH